MGSSVSAERGARQPRGSLGDATVHHLHEQFAAWTTEDAQRAVRGLRSQRPDRVYVGWTALYRALDSADAEREAAAEKRRRAGNHPAAHGFSLRRTEAATALSEEFADKGGAGGGQAPEAGAGPGSAGERTPGAAPAAGGEGSEARAPGEDALDAFEDLGEMDEEELALAEAAGELGGAGPAPSQPAPAAERSLAEEAYYSKPAHQRYMLQLLPEERRTTLRDVRQRASQLGVACDPASSSPVFWGHHATAAAAGDSEAAERRRAQWELLQQFRARQAGRAGGLQQERQRRLDDLHARISAEEEARAQKRRDAAQRREEERTEAERTLPEAEYSIFLSHWRQQQRKIEDAEATEDAERRREEREEERAIRGEGGGGEGQSPEEEDAPLGHKVAGLAREALAAREEELAAKTAAVEKAKAAADKASKGLAARARPSVAKAAHAKVATATEEEQEAKEAMVRLRGEALLAEALERSEARFIPLYEALADPDTRRVNLVEAALLIGLCTSSDLHEKIQFCFAAFDFDESRSLSLDEMVILVSALVRALERLGGLVESMAEQEVHSLAVQAFGDADTDRNGQLSEFEFLRWAKGVVEQDARLSSLFGVPWKYSSFSAFQREGMAPVHKYRLGLLSLSQLQIEVRRRALQHRPMLQPEAKRALHLRALARGGNDPLKASYGRFIQQQRRQAVGRAVAMSHGSLVNALHHEARHAHNAALRIQTAWRGRLGRKAARAAQAKVSFYADRQREIAAAAEEARESVMANESVTGFQRMKWDTHVRMVQARLRSYGRTVDRRGVLQHLAEEAVKEAVAPIMARYARLERERGYRPATASSRPVRAKADTAAPAPAPSAFHASEVLQAGADDASVEEGSRAPEQESAEADEDGAAPASEAGGNAASGLGPSAAAQAEPASGGSGGALDERDPFASFLDQGGSLAPRAVKLLRQQMELRREGRPPAHLRMDTEARRRALRVGETPGRLFRLPPTTVELAEAEGVHDAWADVQHVLAVASDRVASKHAGAFVPESTQQAIAAWLPSKHLLLRLVRAFSGRPASDLGDFLRAEFAVPGRVALPLATELQALEAEDDLGGRVRQLSSSGRGSESALLEGAVAAAADSTIEGVLSTAATARGGGGGGGGGGGCEKATASRRPGAGTLQRRSLERSALATRLERRRGEAVRELAEARTQYEQVLSQVARAEATVRSSDQQLRVLRAAHGDGGAALLLRSVGGRHRCDWMARWWGAVEAPERSFEDAVAKYSEMGAVVADFQACATRVAVTLVREQHMPHLLRSLKPTRSTDPFLLRGERAERVVVHNLRARIVDDETGLFAGSTDLAHKAAASAFRNASLWLLCRGCRRAAHPLITVVDVLGHRVLVTAELPLVAASEEVEGAATWAPQPLSAVAGPGPAWKQAGIAPQVVDPLADPTEGDGDQGAVVDEGAVLSEAEKIKRREQLERRAMALIEPARPSVPLSCTAGGDAGRLVHGTEDYGGTIVAGVDDEAEACLQRFAAVYGLARHAVMSQGARIPVQVPTAATVNARRGVDGRLYVHRMARVMPPEHSEEVAHLPTVPSGLSIFARFLRPEFVRFHAPHSLSSDALSMLAHRAPDGGEHEEALRAATRALVRERIPAFADAVAAWSPERLEAADWGHELHDAGINWRHAGLVRHRFWHKLAGTATVAFGDRRIRTSVPMERQLAPSQAFQVELAGEPLSVEAAALPQEEGSEAGSAAHLIPDPRLVTGPWASELPPHRWGLVLHAPPERHSSTALPLWAGATRCTKEQAAAVRRVLLRELLLRAAAAVGRGVLRESLRRVEYGGDAELAGAGARFLNLVTMADPEGVRFWQRDVQRAVLAKFGRVAVSAREGVDLAATALPHLAWLVPRLASKLGLSVAGPAMSALRREGEANAQAAGAVGFDFAASDMAPPTIAHTRGWQHVAHSAQGRILYLRARKAVRSRFTKRVAAERPLLYFPLNNGPRTRIARNEGLLGKQGDADVHNGAEFTWDGGPLAWAPMQQGGFCRFHAAKQHHLQIGAVPQLAMEDDSQALSVEAWVRVAQSAAQTQVVLQSGRVALYRLRGDAIACALYSVLHSVEVVLRGPTLSLGAWHHVCAAFDGVALRFFLDGALSAELGNVHALAQELAQRALEQRVDRYEKAQAEVEGRRAAARAASLDEGEEYAATAEGHKEVEARMRKLASNPGRAKDVLRALERWEAGMAEHWAKTLARRQKAAEAAEAASKQGGGNAAALLGKGQGVAQRAAAAAAGAWESGQRQARRLQDSDETSSVTGESEAAPIAAPDADAPFTDLRVEGEGGEAAPAAADVSSAGERVRARLETDSPASALQPYSDGELRDMAIRELVRDRLREREAALDEEWSRVKERFLRAQQTALERVHVPLRIGAAAGRSSRSANQCYEGDVAHVAVHGAALKQVDVLRRLTQARENPSRIGMRHYEMALSRLRRAIRLRPDDARALKFFADAVCADIGLGPDRLSWRGRYVQRVRTALREFVRAGSVDGALALALALPKDDPANSDLVCEVLDAVERMQPGVLGRRGEAAVALAGTMFGLGMAVSREARHRRWAAVVLRAGLRVDGRACGTHHDVAWLTQLRSDRVLCRVLAHALGRPLLDDGNISGTPFVDVGPEEWRRAAGPEEEEEAGEPEDDGGALWGAAHAALEETEELISTADALSSDGTLVRLHLDGCAEVEAEDLDLLSDWGREVAVLTLPRIAGPRLTPDALAVVCSRMRHLRALDVSHTRTLTSDALKRVVSQCGELEVLRMRGCQQLEDASVAAVAAACPTLLEVDAHDVRTLTDATLTAFGRHCKFLRRIDVGWSVLVTDDGLSAFAAEANADALVSLGLAHCRRITDAGAVAVAQGLTGLVRLDLSYCARVTTHGVARLTHGLVHLKGLRLRGLPDVQDEAFQHSAAVDDRAMALQHMLRSVEVLDLRDCTALTDGVLRALGERAIKRLRMLSLFGCEGLGGRGLDACFQGGRHGAGFSIKSLDLSYTGADDRTVADVATYARGVEVLRLRGCTALTQRAVTESLASMSRLTEIDLAHARYAVTDESLRALAGAADRMWLERVDISYCKRVTDDGVDALTAAYGGIRSVAVRWCTRLSDRTVQCVAARLDHLALLDVRDCPAISAQVVGQLRGARPRARVLASGAAADAKGGDEPAEEGEEKLGGSGGSGPEGGAIARPAEVEPMVVLPLFDPPEDGGEEPGKEADEASDSDALLRELGMFAV